jgi:hypothetical protein
MNPERQRAAACGSVRQRAAAGDSSVRQRAAACGSVRQRAAACGSVQLITARPDVRGHIMNTAQIQQSETGVSMQHPLKATAVCGCARKGQTQSLRLRLPLPSAAAESVQTEQRCSAFK